jgi:hypothetical protein
MACDGLRWPQGQVLMVPPGCQQLESASPDLLGEIVRR